MLVEGVRKGWEKEEEGKRWMEGEKINKKGGTIIKLHPIPLREKVTVRQVFPGTKPRVATWVHCNSLSGMNLDLPFARSTFPSFLLEWLSRRFGSDLSFIAVNLTVLRGLCLGNSFGTWWPVFPLWPHPCLGWRPRSCPGLTSAKGCFLMGGYQQPHG